VVNISTTQTLRGEGLGPRFPGLPKDDPGWNWQAIPELNLPPPTLYFSRSMEGNNLKGGAQVR
jgi:hypothetical protein